MVSTQTLSRRMYGLWWLLLFVFSSQTTVAQAENEVVAQAENGFVFDLPSFSFLLKVSKADDALIVFEDRLQNAIHEHLVDFFGKKVEIPDFGRAYVDEVALRSNLVWKKLSTKKETKGEVTEYEVQSDFDCEVTIIVDSTENSKMRLSKSIMDLFMIESFQGDNYWHLVHNFLSDESLEGITDVKITVFSDAYVSAYNSGDEPPPIPNGFLDEDSNVYQQDRLSPAMTAGVVFSFFFFAAIILMWVYICFFVKKAGLFKGNSRYFSSGDDLSKATLPDNNGSDASFDLDYVDNETRWMDAWANSITSIPLRKPVKTKKRMRNAVRNPAKSHVTHLDSINEAASEDECSIASTIKDEEGRCRTKEVKTRSEQGQLQAQPTGSCIVNLASINEEVGEEKEAQGVQEGSAQSPITVGDEDCDNRALVVAKPRAVSHWVSALNFRNNPSSSSTGAPPASTSSQLSVEKNLHEIC